jgi:outer membrane lipoprotein SlyB
MQKLSMTLPIIVVSALLGACATMDSGYSRNDVHAIESVQYGVIEDVRPVDVAGTHYRSCKRMETRCDPAITCAW